jgi:hypothetical protein
MRYSVGSGLGPRRHSRYIRTCCGMAAATPWRTRATTPGRCRLGWGTKTSRTPCVTLGWHRIGSRTSGDRAARSIQNDSGGGIREELAARKSSSIGDQGSAPRQPRPACCTSTTLRTFWFPSKGRARIQPEARSTLGFAHRLWGNLHGRNLACALMRSRVHNWTTDRGGEPIRLTEGKIAPVLPGPGWGRSLRRALDARSARPPHPFF